MSTSAVGISAVRRISRRLSASTAIGAQTAEAVEPVDEREMANPRRREVAATVAVRTTNRWQSCATTGRVHRRFLNHRDLHFDRPAGDEPGQPLERLAERVESCLHVVGDQARCAADAAARTCERSENVGEVVMGRAQAGRGGDRITADPELVFERRLGTERRP